MKLTWKIQNKPTGRFGSFQKRGWPSAEFETGDMAFRISSADDYIPSLVKTGNHTPLDLWIADYRRTPDSGRFTWRKVKKQYATLDEAKAAALRVAEAHPEMMPWNNE